jgi:hypothetical protein
MAKIRMQIINENNKGNIKNLRQIEDYMNVIRNGKHKTS